MNWDLAIDPELVRKVRRWGGIYPPLPAAILHRLEHQLAVAPEMHLYQTLTPMRYPQYSIIFEEVEGIPDSLRCDFSVEVDADSRRLTVLDGYMSTPRAR